MTIELDRHHREAQDQDKVRERETCRKELAGCEDSAVLQEGNKGVLRRADEAIIVLEISNLGRLNPSV